MRRSGLYLLVGFIVVLSSCQKELSDINPVNGGTTPTTPITGSQSLVRTYKEDVVSPISGNSSYTFNLTYDSLNRIKSMVSIANAGDKFVYAYGSGSYTMDLYNVGVLSIHETFFLNSNNLVDSTLQYNDTNDTTAEKYIYDANKHLKQLKRYDVINGSSVLTETTFYTHDANGNVLTESDGTTTSLTYTYNTAQLNTLNIGQVYFAVNKHLTQTTTANLLGVPVVFTHSYTFDSNNRITSEKAVSAIPGQSQTHTYTY
jgi:hypothetical protein